MVRRKDEDRRPGRGRETGRGKRGLLLLSLFVLLLVLLLSGACGTRTGSSPEPGERAESGQAAAAEADSRPETAAADPAEMDSRPETVAADPAESGAEAQTETPPVPPGPAEEKSAFVIPEGDTLETRFAVPEGYARIPYDEGSFGSFVRGYAMKPDGSPVLLWTGDPKGNQEDHAAVFAMKVEDRKDLQQCADSVMRIYAEYYRATDQYDRIRFSFGGGFVCDYDTYIKGYRIKSDDAGVRWVKSGEPGDSDEVFDNYLKIVFAYAGTRTMVEESAPISLEDIRIGDIFLKGGSPGHVVMVADVCEKDGKKAFLLAQGYMPAQEFHVIKNPRHEDDPWYYEEEVQYPFQTQAYTFPEGALRRPEY